MKKQNNNLAYYIQKLNDIVQETEKIGETMNPHYERIRECLDADRIDSISEEELKDIRAEFVEGTEKYVALNDQINKLTPPVKVIGVHKKFVTAFDKYLEGCQQMVESVSIENGVNVELFNESEQIQDEATDVISFCISRMTSLLMKR